MKLWEKIFNGILVFILIGSITWFITTQHDNFNFSDKATISVENNIDWNSLVPGISSVTVFFLRYFLIERKKKKKSSTSLTDHLIFDTIEDMVENDVKHRNFGSEGRTEAMRIMITIQLDTYAATLRRFIEENPKFEDGTDFRKKLRSCIFRMVEDTNKRWVERQLPQPLINKYSALYKHRIDLLLSDVLSATLTMSVENNEALNTFLNDARIVFRSGLLEDVLLALRSMNGELSGLTFNGKKL